MTVTVEKRVGTIRPVERACYLVAAVLLVSGAVHLVVFVLGDRPWDGPVSWRKPATFGLSFGLTLATVAWVARHLRMSGRTRTRLLTVLAIDSVVEVTGITIQAWRGVPSHLNTETPTDAAIAYTLAVGGGVLVVVLGTMAVFALRGRIDGPADVRLAVRAGFALLVAGLFAGVAMIVRGTSLVREGDRTRAYDDAGFLKAFHGVTLHAVLVLPALAWLLAHRGVDEQRRVRIVASAVAVYVASAVVVLIRSLVLV